MAFISLYTNAQIYNNGATITVTNNALVFCQGNFQNASGTVTNDGRIEVQGNFDNAGTYNTTTANDSLIMSGGSAATLNSGASSITNLTINKSAGIKVALAGNTQVLGKLDYQQGILTTNPLTTTFVLSSPVAAVYNFSAGREIVGRVKRTGWANGNTVIFNHPNMQVTTNGGTAPGDITVNMIPQSEGGDPTQAEKEMKRFYKFSVTGGSGFTSNARLPYNTTEADDVNIEANLVPWKLNGSEWVARLNNYSLNTANDYVDVNSIPADTLLQEWKLADPYYSVNLNAILRGAWNSTTGAMNTTLNTAGIIPLSQPYNVAPFNYAGTETVGSIPNANVVDWVLLEVRKPASGAAADAGSTTIIGRTAAFLLSNGDIVDINGLSKPKLPFYKQGSGNYLVVRHRNHLGVMSNLPVATNATLANDFRILSSVYKSSSAASDPVSTLTSSTNYGMWTGDAAGTTGAGSVNISDLNAIKAAIANSLTGYARQDVNLSNSINTSDLNLVKLTIATSGSTSTPLRVSDEKRDVKSSLPE
jgi:hypothetical protein